MVLGWGKIELCFWINFLVFLFGSTKNRTTLFKFIQLSISIYKKIKNIIFIYSRAKYTLKNNNYCAYKQFSTHF